MVYYGECCILSYILYCDEQRNLVFFFFADKPKSFKKKYKKEHNFFYRLFFRFVYNREYMKNSRFYKYILRYYIAYLFQMLLSLMLFVLGVFGNTAKTMNVTLFGIIYLAIGGFSCIHYMWVLLHSKKRPGFHWYLPATWWRSDFFIDLPGCDKNGHVKKQK